MVQRQVFAEDLPKKARSENVRLEEEPSPMTRSSVRSFISPLLFRGSTGFLERGDDVMPMLQVFLCVVHVFKRSREVFCGAGPPKCP